MEAIYILRRLIERYLKIMRDLHMVLLTYKRISYLEGFIEETILCK